MIYCSLEPGLMSICGLALGDIATADKAIAALGLHWRMAKETDAKIPVTGPFVATILDDLDKIQIAGPPIKRNFSNLVRQMLTRTQKPLLVPARAGSTAVDPAIVSPWVSAALTELWIDSLNAAIADIPTVNNGLTQDSILAVATYERSGLPFDVHISNDTIGAILATSSATWTLPVIANEHDWKLASSHTEPWGDCLEMAVEEYARRHLAIPPQAIDSRKAFEFEPSCLRAVRDEADPVIRRKLVEAMACLVYNRLQPHHHDETIKDQKGMRRLRVKKMTPAVRFHYKIVNSAIIFTLFSNGKHNKGL